MDNYTVSTWHLNALTFSTLPFRLTSPSLQFMFTITAMRLSLWRPTAELLDLANALPRLGQSTRRRLLPPRALGKRRKAHRLSEARFTACGVMSGGRRSWRSWRLLWSAIRYVSIFSLLEFRYFKLKESSMWRLCSWKNVTSMSLLAMANLLLICNFERERERERERENGQVALSLIGVAVLTCVVALVWWHKGRS